MDRSLGKPEEGRSEAREGVKGESRAEMREIRTSRSNRMSKWDSRLSVQGSRLW